MKKFHPKVCNHGEGPSRGLLRAYEPSDGTFSSTRAHAGEMDHRPADGDGSGGLLAVYNIAEQTGDWRVLPAIIQPAN